ncbi:hypothetical protein D2Q93_13815 [Alicyclobacillaceae bacterium I2511]|jgi:hypothetical protein|nr:hypothetical protein D2Q93_13815 [Alicyclobacillaceae bacterium I2511]
MVNALLLNILAHRQLSLLMEPGKVAYYWPWNQAIISRDTVDILRWGDVVMNVNFIDFGG